MKTNDYDFRWLARSRRRSQRREADRHEFPGIPTTADHRLIAGNSSQSPIWGVAIVDDRTTIVVQRYLDELAGGGPAEPAVQALLDRAAGRLWRLCAGLLYRSYPRLTRPPLNLQV